MLWALLTGWDLYLPLVRSVFGQLPRPLVCNLSAISFRFLAPAEKIVSCEALYKKEKEKKKKKKKMSSGKLHIITGEFCSTTVYIIVVSEYRNIILVL